MKYTITINGQTLTTRSLKAVHAAYDKAINSKQVVTTFVDGQGRDMRDRIAEETK